MERRAHDRLPTGTFGESVDHGSIWVGPQKSTHPKTGEYGDRARSKIATLTIRDIDFDYGGFRHALRVEWVLRDKGDSRTIDHRIHTFAPGKGVVHLR